MTEIPRRRTSSAPSAVVAQRRSSSPKSAQQCDEVIFVTILQQAKHLLQF